MSLEISRLRNRLRERRRCLTPDQQQQAAARAQHHLRQETGLWSIRRMAFYLASDGELDPMPLVQWAWRRQLACYLPVLYPLRHNRLWFARWSPGDPLQPNRYGIPEPLWSASSLVKPWALDLVIMPLVAFSAEGARLGMGGGYYDRSFGWRLRRQHWRGPKLVGYAHEFQQVSGLEPRPWDVPLDLVVTDARVYRFT